MAPPVNNMGKKEKKYSCQQCGFITVKWLGKCPDCNAWGSIIEVAEAELSSIAKGKPMTLNRLDTIVSLPERTMTNISEFDRVLGGGFVAGSAILLGGEPGIGKSTILLQIAANVQDMQILYVSAEESVDQCTLRARRIVSGSVEHLRLISSNSVEDIIATLMKYREISLVIIDSIQTMQTNSVDSLPGTISQVRSASDALIAFAKATGVTIIFVGHVTKDGAIAGPKVLEHMVDTVLYFEGNRTDNYRVLRTIKNRFGATNEIGIFEMLSTGLKVVDNPSELFLATHNDHASGNVVFAGMEGSRPVMVEIQALVVDTSMPTPRRAVVGWDSNRLAMIIAVLYKRYGIFLADKEIYLNVAGGMKITETAADLAVVFALISSATDVVLPSKLAICGEIALSGSIRNISNLDIRMKEACKLGFKHAIIPRTTKEISGIKTYQISDIKQVNRIFDRLTHVTSV